MWVRRRPNATLVKCDAGQMRSNAQAHERVRRRANAKCEGAGCRVQGLDSGLDPEHKLGSRSGPHNECKDG